MGAPSLQLSSRALRSYLPRQRWFGAKDRPLSDSALSCGVSITAGARSWRLTLLAVAYADGSRDRYLMPLGCTRTAEERPAGPVIAALGDGTCIYDAAAEPEFVRALIAAMASGTEVPMEGGPGRVHFSSTSALTSALQRHAASVSHAAIRALGAEQSNTSIVIEDFAVLKFYRHVQSGASPEIEMTRFLTERAYQGTPALLGSIELVDGGSPAAGLGVLTAWTANRGDAWNAFALAYLRRALGARSQGQDEAAFFTLLERLSRRTAELHRMLCPREPVEAAFAPEPISAADVAAWRAQVRAEAAAMLTHLSARLLQGRAAGCARQLLERKQTLLQRIDSAVQRPATAVRTRVHGDYHLGQVLFTGEDFRIIDFEGEPRRPIAERRGKHSPLKDVAGMLRSFDYAAAAALRELQPQGEADAALRARIDRWRRQAHETFLSGYREAMAGCASYPTDESSARELLDLFGLEKAIYEVGYELANRPDWLCIPTAGILELLEPRRCQRVSA